MSRLSNIYLNNIDLGPSASLAKSNLQLPLQLFLQVTIPFFQSISGLCILSQGNPRITFWLPSLVM